MPTFFDDEDYEIWEKDQLIQDTELEPDEEEYPRNEDDDEWDEDWGDEDESPFDVDDEDD